MLQEGFDVPSIECILMCRPTKSRALYFQQVGRGLRISPHTLKTDCLVLDQALNVKRHGFVEMLKKVSLTKGVDKPPGEAPAKDCPQCGHIMYALLMVCPQCGYEFERKPKYIPAGPLDLILSKEDKVKYKWFQANAKLGYERGYLPGWPAMCYRDQCGGYPPNDWSKHAIFGNKYTEADQRTYYEYLVGLALKHEKTQAWVSMYWRLEFGENIYAKAV